MYVIFVYLFSLYIDRLFLNRICINIFYYIERKIVECRKCLFLEVVIINKMMKIGVGFICKNKV